MPRDSKGQRVVYAVIYQGLCRALSVPPRGIRGSAFNVARRQMLPTVAAHTRAIMRRLAELGCTIERAKRGGKVSV